MRLFLLLTLLLGFSVPAIAYNEFNGGDSVHYDCYYYGCGVINGSAEARMVLSLKMKEVVR